MFSIQLTNDKVFSRWSKAIVSQNLMELPEILENGKIAFTYIKNSDMEELNNQDGDHENIVNYGRNIEGVEVSIFFREKDGKYKVSLRSNEYVDVSVIATLYSGGGHTKASGFEILGTLEEAKESVIAEIKKQLK